MWREMLCLQLAHQTEGPKEAVLEKPCNGKKGDGASGESKTSSRLHTLSLRVLAEHTINIPAASTWLGIQPRWVTQS